MVDARAVIRGFAASVALAKDRLGHVAPAEEHVAQMAELDAQRAALQDKMAQLEAQCAGAEGEVEEASRDYYVRFEAFGPPASEAKLSEAVRKAVELMRGLMKDFPGLLAPSAMAAVEREHGYAVC